ncbi:MAG: hypothetical protein ACTHM5_02020 [Ginsengibacter sp.]
MKCVIKCIIAAIVFLIHADITFCQDTRPVMDQLAKRLDAYTTKEPQTSVYISASKDIYVCGEDLWFNAFILNAQDFALSALDKTLHLQLQQKGSDSAVWQEMYPIINGVAAGHVFLPQTLPEGDYLLKAYTAHSFFANQPYFYAFAPIRVVKEPRTIISNKRQGQETSISKSHIQFKVFPEGGNLVAGLQNRVAFKAVNRDGRPEEVSGTLLKNGAPILSFKTIHAGMGSFLFTPEKNATYRIKLENNDDSLYTLPKTEDSGMVMRLVKNESDSLVFKITAHHIPEGKKIFLRLQIRGMVQAIAAGTLTDSLEIKFPVKSSPQGIAEATLFDEELRPLAERLVYLHPDQKLNISFSPLKEHYGQKEKVSVKIKTTDASGNAVPAIASLRVYDRLFEDTANTRDIVNYYYLSTQLRGNIYAPSYYFDSTRKNRKEALDLLLLTQGWRRYTWNEAILKEEAAGKKPVVSDSLQARVTAVKKAGKEKQPLSLMLFNYNKSITQFAVAGSAGRFYLTPENLAIGPRLFIKYFSEKDHQIKIANPFAAIKMAEATHYPEYLFTKKYLEQKKPIIDTSDALQYEKTLEEVTVVAKGRGYSDRYLGYLDSIAKYEGNTDYVCRLNPKGYLNCPWCGSSLNKPVEGQEYPVFIGTRKVTSHVVDGWIKAEETKHVIYHYPKYTEEELLKKFKMGVTKGYFQSKEFYEPNYDKANSSVPDNRNTLAWNPTIVTDKNGEATFHFFCSDIRSRFIGVVEGVNGEGLLGVGKFNFNVR